MGVSRRGTHDAAAATTIVGGCLGLGLVATTIAARTGLPSATARPAFATGPGWLTHAGLARAVGARRPVGNETVVRTGAYPIAAVVDETFLPLVAACGPRAGMVFVAGPQPIAGVGIGALRVTVIATRRAGCFVIIEAAARGVAAVGIGAVRVAPIATGRTLGLVTALDADPRAAARIIDMAGDPLIPARRP
jgi:hypothetical protein